MIPKELQALFIVDAAFKYNFEALSLVKQQSLAFLIQKAGDTENRIKVGKIIADCLSKNIIESKIIIQEIRLKMS